jgi:hypothetical protein
LLETRAQKVKQMGSGYIDLVNVAKVLNHTNCR